MTLALFATLSLININRAGYQMTGGVLLATALFIWLLYGFIK